MSLPPAPPPGPLPGGTSSGGTSFGGTSFGGTALRAVRPTPLPLLLLLLLSLLLSTPACTTLPATEFHTYRAAFAQSRTAGEALLLDWAAADARRRALDPLARPSTQADAHLTQWSASAVHARLHGLDPVAVRLHAWRITADYGDALLALAEGRNAEALSQSIGALSEGLATFPWDQLGGGAARLAQSIGGPIGPAVEAIRALAAEAQREADRRKFLAAVASAAPFIRELTALLKADADDFWNVRIALFNPAHGAALSSLDTHMDAIERILAEHGDVRYVDKNADGLDSAQAAAHLLAVLDYRLRVLTPHDEGIPLHEPPADPAVYDEPAALRLRELAAAADDRITEYVLLEHGLRSYKEALTAYVELLIRTDDAHAALAAAAQNSSRTPPPARDIAAAALLLRRTLAQYEKAR